MRQQLQSKDQEKREQRQRGGGKKGGKKGGKGGGGEEIVIGDGEGELEGIEAEALPFSGQLQTPGEGGPGNR